MSAASTASRAKAIRLCGGGAPSMRKHREDGGANGGNDGGSSGGPVEAPIPVMPPPPPPVAAKSADDKDPTVSIKVGPEPLSAGPKPLNAGVMRRGGRTRSKRQ